MTFDEYEQECLRTASSTKDIAVLALGLCGEAGEFAELVKKMLGHNIPLDVAKAEKELGDVLWYLTALAELVCSSLESVAEANVEKLRARYPEGFTEGGGIRE